MRTGSGEQRLLSAELFFEQFVTLPSKRSITRELPGSNGVLDELKLLSRKEWSVEGNEQTGLPLGVKVFDLTRYILGDGLTSAPDNDPGNDQ